nr:YneF family protein [Gracilibacillus ureilyticus]
MIGGTIYGIFYSTERAVCIVFINPIISMLRTLMMQMGQKPSQKKIKQMMRAMNNQVDNK